MTIAITTGLTRNHIRPAPNARRILVLNLMPTRAVTEQQIAAALGNTDTNLALTFALPATHQVRHHAAAIRAAYPTLAEMADQHFDGLIVTGAALDQLPFTAVDFWPEFRQLLTWRRTHVEHSLFLCWGAYAALHVDGVADGHQITHKINGIYTTNGVTMPHSRYFTIPITSVQHGKVVAGDDRIGATIITDAALRSTYITGHLEYWTGTLASEFHRDQHRGLTVAPPSNYFDHDMRPVNSWQHDTATFYRHWVHQLTPQEVTAHD
ncbi:homoserine O-acetyltransferase/O-succinyltransferase family protein [Lacticaseibacillus thailandensis]|nr:homoserine O-succinyltransferase [Lacticaseibacillus thailandensis]